MDERTIARFNAKVDRSGGPDACWPWKLKPDKSGYGRLTVNKKCVKAHRIAFFVAHGYWPTPECLHSCDNPPCCNPRHLSAGTMKQNHEQKCARQRHVFGERHYRHKLRASDIPVILALAASGSTYREIADEYGVTFALIGFIVRGRIWKQVTGAAVPRSGTMSRCR